MFKRFASRFGSALAFLLVTFFAQPTWAADAGSRTLDDPQYQVIPVYTRGPVNIRIQGIGTPVPQEAFLVGLAEFLFDRSQAEISDWALRDAFSGVCKSSSLSLAFRHTCLLRASYSDATVVSIGGLREALQSDLVELPFTFLKDKALAAVLVSTAEALRKGGGILAVCSGLSKTPAVDQASLNTNKALFALKIVGAVFAEVQNTNAFDVASLKKVLTNLDPSLDSAQNPNVAPFLQRASQLTELIINTSVRPPKTPSPSAVASPDAPQLVTELARLLLASFVLAGEPSAKDVMSALDAYIAILNGSYAEALEHFAHLIDGADDTDNVAALRRVLPLAAEIADAHSAADVKGVLASLASPVGAWRRKREHASVTLGAIVGVAALKESLYAKGTVDRGDLSAPVVGLLAPVGVDISFPVNGVSTLGLFVSVIDVGNLVSARLKKPARDAASNLPQARLQNVLSPGVLLRIGLGRSPFVATAGASWSPGLRHVETRASAEEPASALRVGIGVGVDITIVGS